MYPKCAPITEDHPPGRPLASRTSLHCENTTFEPSPPARHRRSPRRTWRRVCPIPPDPLLDFGFGSSRFWPSVASPGAGLRGRPGPRLAGWRDSRPTAFTPPPEPCDVTPWPTDWPAKTSRSISERTAADHTATPSGLESRQEPRRAVRVLRAGAAERRHGGLAGLVATTEALAALASRRVSE